ASSPSDIDLGCGFHDSFSSGTRSSTRRVVACSCSSSRRIAAIDIGLPPGFENDPRMVSLRRIWRGYGAIFHGTENHFSSLPLSGWSGQRPPELCDSSATGSEVLRKTRAWQHPCRRRGQGVVHVVIRPRIVRRVVIVVAVLLVSGAAAAMKLTSWTPASMCFCPTSDHPDSAVKSDSGIEAVAPAGSLKVPLDTSTIAHSSSGAFGAAPV